MMPWLALLVLLAAGLLAAPAFGDADPASDVLLYQDVFYPYQPVVGAGPKAQLDAVVASAHKAGFPIKVAIIATQGDLGAVSSFYADPHGYARFLEPEIQVKRPVPLLVAMPAGIGTAAVGAKGAAAAGRGLPSLADQETDGLVRAAVGAVRRIAAAHGHPLPPPPALPPAAARTRAGRAHRGGGTPLALILAPVGLLALGALALSLRRRRGPSESRDSP